MNRERILAGLSLLVMQLANGESLQPPDWSAHEWAYVKGLASGAILRMFHVDPWRVSDIPDVSDR